MFNREERRVVAWLATYLYKGWHESYTGLLWWGGGIMLVCPVIVADGLWSAKRRLEYSVPIDALCASVVQKISTGETRKIPCPRGCAPVEGYVITAAALRAALEECDYSGGIVDAIEGFPLGRLRGRKKKVA